MAFELKLSYKERNDNTALIFQDVSNFGEEYDELYNGDATVTGTMYAILQDGGHDTFTTAGAADSNVGTRFVSEFPVTLSTNDVCVEVSPLPSEIIEATMSLNYQTSNGETSGPYNVDLFAEFGPFSSQADLVYTINGSHVGMNDGDLIPDGIWQVTYTLTARPAGNDGNNDQNFVADPITTEMLVYGQVKVKVYDKLRNIPVSYLCNNAVTVDNIEEAELAAAYLKGIEASAYISKSEELLKMLGTLEKILTLGTNIY